MTSSTISPTASKAGARWSALTATPSAVSPTSRSPTRWTTASARRPGRPAMSPAIRAMTSPATGWAEYVISLTFRPPSWSRTTPSKVTTAPAARSSTAAASPGTETRPRTTSARTTRAIVRPPDSVVPDVSDVSALSAIVDPPGWSASGARRPFPERYTPMTAPSAWTPRRPVGALVSSAPCTIPTAGGHDGPEATSRRGPPARIVVAGTEGGPCPSCSVRTPTSMTSSPH